MNKYFKKFEHRTPKLLILGDSMVFLRIKLDNFIKFTDFIDESLNKKSILLIKAPSNNPYHIYKSISDNLLKLNNKNNIVIITRNNDELWMKNIISSNMKVKDNIYIRTSKCFLNDKETQNFNISKKKVLILSDSCFENIFLKKVDIIYDTSFTEIIKNNNNNNTYSNVLS